MISSMRLDRHRSETNDGFFLCKLGATGLRAVLEGIERAGKIAAWNSYKDFALKINARLQLPGQSTIRRAAQRCYGLLLDQCPVVYPLAAKSEDGIRLMQVLFGEDCRELIGLTILAAFTELEVVRTILADDNYAKELSTYYEDARHAYRPSNLVLPSITTAETPIDNPGPSLDNMSAAHAVQASAERAHDYAALGMLGSIPIPTIPTITSTTAHIIEEIVAPEESNSTDSDPATSLPTPSDSSPANGDVDGADLQGLGD